MIWRIKFLKPGIVLYTLIKNINKELSVNAKYCPQWIPNVSVPDLSKSDLTTFPNNLYKSYKVI